MFDMRKDPTFIAHGTAFGVLEVQYGDRDTWQVEALRRREAEELDAIKATAASYDRAMVFGNNPYVRYFKKFKKTYQVLQQVESFLLKDRPFPQYDPIGETSFLVELKTHYLLGTHDIEKFQGQPVLYCPEEKTPFVGIGGRDVHAYPGDVTVRDDGGVTVSMIGGPDERTCLRPESTHIAYLIFGAPGVTDEEISAVMDELSTLVLLLAPTAKMEKQIISAAK
jgi:DNA/RNA-binding domain of Phe-tRNA-synthetase-like protein